MKRAGAKSRREELLDIAATEFAARGFANVTVDELGATAGVSGPALYHHFSGKEALLGEMLVGISRRLLDGGAAISQSMTADTLGELVRFHCHFAVHERDLITVHMRDLNHASAADQRTVRRLQSRYVALWVDALQARHADVDRGTARAAVHAAFGLMNSTPFSGSLPAERMQVLLEQMTLTALDAAGPGGRDCSCPR